MTTVSSDPVLTVEHVTMRFGGLTAVSDLSFQAARNDITALIGPNGAGKTTVFNCITGFYKPTEGRVTLRHADGTKYLLEQMDDFRISRTAKVARTFQNIRLFAGMTVLENLMVAQHNELMKASAYTIGGIFNTGTYSRANREAVEHCKYWLNKTGLTARADDPAGELAYGDQRRLEIARAMCTKPLLLCLDEPAAGLNPRESEDLNRLLLDIRKENQIAILLIEHDMSVVMGISDHIVVLDYGVKIADGTPAEIRNDPAVIRAYLGVADDEEEAQVEALGVPPPPPGSPSLPPSPDPLAEELIEEEAQQEAEAAPVPKPAPAAPRVVQAEPVRAAPAKTAPAKKTAAKTSPAKKAPAKKAPAKKPASRKGKT